MNKVKSIALSASIIVLSGISFFAPEYNINEQSISGEIKVLKPISSFTVTTPLNSSNLKPKSTDFSAMKPATYYL